MSGGRPVGFRVRLTGSDGLVVGSGMHGPVAADASDSGRLLFVGLPLCDVSAVAGPCVWGSAFGRSGFVRRACGFGERPLGVYPSDGHSVSVDSV